jgi:hypothetical protein
MDAEWDILQKAAVFAAYGGVETGKELDAFRKR